MIKPANPKHEAFFQAIIKEIKKAELSNIDMVCVVSNLLGKLMAYQDQRQYTSEQLIKIVQENIELGNKQAIDELSNFNGTKQ